MNYLDIIIAIVLLFFGIKGLKKGIIVEVASLLAFIVGIYGAMHFSDFTAERLVEYIEINPKYINTVAFILTFVLLALLVNLIGKLASKLAKSLNLGFLDKLGGFVFGAAKGVLLCSLLVMVLNNLELLKIVKPEVKQESFLYPYVERTVPYVYQGFDLVKDAIEDFNNSEKEIPVQDTVPVQGTGSVTV